MDGAGLVAPRWRRLRLLAAAMLLAAFVLSCGPKVKVAPVPPPSPEQQPTPFQSAERYYEAKQYGKAMALYRDFLRRQPTHPSADTAIIKLATILTAFGNNAEAADWYRRLLLTRPASPYAPQAAGELISILFIEERYAELIAVARKLGPNMLSGAIGARTLMLIGDAYRITGDTPAAAAAYIRGQQNSPSPDDPRWEEKIEGTIGSLSLADIDRLTADLQAREIRPRLLLLLARANGDREQWQAAVRVLGQYLADYPEGPDRPEVERLAKRYYARSRLSHHVIGCALPLTGKFALYGQRALRGIELAVNNLGQTAGPTEIGLLIKDTGSNAEQAAGAVDALAQAGVTAIIGPIGGAEAAARRAQENRIPIITLTQKSDIVDIGDFVFRNFLTPGLQARALAEHAVAVMGLRRIAVLYPDEPYGRRFMLLFWKELVQFGGRITGIESYSADQTDFATPIKKLGGLHYEIPEDLKPPPMSAIRASRRLAADPAGSRGCAASRRSPGPPRVPGQPGFIRGHARAGGGTSKRCLSRMRLTWSALSPRSWPSMTSKGFACSAPTSGTPSVCWTSVESMSRTLCSRPVFRRQQRPRHPCLCIGL
jgi:branched-chain amino acid transport system substrate-binding protein